MSTSRSLKDTAGVKRTREGSRVVAAGTAHADVNGEDGYDNMELDGTDHETADTVVVATPASLPSASKAKKSKTMVSAAAKRRGRPKKKRPAVAESEGENEEDGGGGIKVEEDAGIKVKEDAGTKVKEEKEEENMPPPPPPASATKKGKAKVKAEEEERPFIPPEVRRSGRARATPKDAYAEAAEHEKRAAPPPRSKAKAKAKTAATGSSAKTTSSSNRAATGGKKWDPEYLMTNPKSPYTTMDISTLFTESVWELLTPEEQASLLRLLPESALVYEAPASVSDDTPPKPQLRPGFWGSDNAPLRSAIAGFQEDLELGRRKPSYVEAARVARERRLAGDFDAYKDNAFEEFWGQRQKLAYDSIAGEASSVKLSELMRHHALRIGDIFSLRRNFSGGIVIRKDAVLTDVDTKTYALTFSYPPGDHEFANEALRPNIVATGVLSATALGNQMLREHSSCPAKIPNGNAFKEFRIVRKQEDIGSLFEVRQDFWRKYLADK